MTRPHRQLSLCLLLLAPLLGPACKKAKDRGQPPVKAPPKAKPADPVATANHQRGAAGSKEKKFLKQPSAKQGFAGARNLNRISAGKGHNELAALPAGNTAQSDEATDARWSKRLRSLEQEQLAKLQKELETNQDRLRAENAKAKPAVKTVASLAAEGKRLRAQIKTFETSLIKLDAGGYAERVAWVRAALTAVRRLGKRHYEVDRRFLAQTIAHPEWWKGLATLSPIKVDGQVQGFGLITLAKDCWLNDVGLKAGDVLLALGEHRLARPIELAAFVKKLTTLERFTLVFERKGQRVTIVGDLTDLPTERAGSGGAGGGGGLPVGPSLLPGGTPGPTERE